MNLVNFTHYDIPMAHTLKLFNTGQITLPKAWRTQYDTKNFLAIETAEGLLIKPLIDKNEVVYYEDPEGFGLYAPDGLDPAEILSSLKRLKDHG